MLHEVQCGVKKNWENWISGRQEKWQVWNYLQQMDIIWKSYRTWEVHLLFTEVSLRNGFGGCQEVIHKEGKQGERYAEVCKITQKLGNTK